MLRDAALLEDIRLNARHALTIVDGVTIDRFLAEIVLNYAVVRCLSIIGEAANHVSEETRREHPELDWAGMIGLRHVLVHDYGRVDLDEVWAIVHRDLPELIAVLDRKLEGLP